VTDEPREIAGDPEVLTPDTAPAEKERGFGYYVGLALSIGLILIVAFFAVILIILPKIAGAIPLTILTSSMEPGLPPGTLIIVQPVEPDDVRVGDVITYQIRSGDPAVITHRVIAIDSDSSGALTFTLLGDNNGEPDDPVREVQIKARLWYAVPYLGFVNSAVNGDNKSWIIPLAAGLLLSYAAWMIVSGLIAASRKKKGSGRRAAGR
jgi:signal peptidase